DSLKTKGPDTEHKKIAYGSLKVICSAPNNTISLKNESENLVLSPNKFTSLKVGKYSVRITARNYTPVTKVVTISKGKTTKINANMLPQKRISNIYQFVKGGYFNMYKEENHNKYSREIFLNDFYISKFEVTQKKWELIMGYNNSFFEGDNRPVENINWFEAVEFCNQKSISENLKSCYTISGSTVECNFNANGYRLPTEAEWEYAAKGGQKTNNYIFSGSNNLDEVAWYNQNSNNRSHSVGQKKTNELGLFDMSGNVWEWCWDRFGKYENKAEYNPNGPSSGSLKTRRQGSWTHSGDYCKVGFREMSSPNIKSASIGFRCVRSGVDN
ncbi:MAG: SUMF1/EgtB/PvdO family nonheme iron enzyme, partial [Candidatus Cloacimonadota bacterium]|nr:SUMF1/EgtB/PvdO family nonheme iron enzyme [Candidatus Cloacimonadota bacterium]